MHSYKDNINNFCRSWNLYSVHSMYNGLPQNNTYIYIHSISRPLIISNFLPTLLNVYYLTKALKLFRADTEVI